MTFYWATQPEKNKTNKTKQNTKLSNTSTKNTHSHTQKQQKREYRLFCVSDILSNLQKQTVKLLLPKQIKSSVSTRHS